MIWQSKRREDADLSFIANKRESWEGPSLWPQAMGCHYIITIDSTEASLRKDRR